MLAGLWASIVSFINPLYTQPSALIQPQERLRPGYEPAAEGPWEDIITGVYGTPPLLKIHDRRGIVKWTWHRDDVSDQDLPKNIRRCLHSHANDATELKWLRNGTSVAAIYSNLVMIVNHNPPAASARYGATSSTTAAHSNANATDKQITFALCRDNEFLHNAHSFEMLPGDRIAVGTTGQRPWDGILVYNASLANPVVEKPPVLQNITGLRAIHGMIWDETEQLLWAAGTDAAADGSDPVPAYGVLQAYPFDNTTGELRTDESLRYRFPKPYDEVTEWGVDYTWWSGPHDLVPVPFQRKFLLSNDRDLFAFDIPSGQFTDQGEAVTRKYMPGFEVTSHDRHGHTREGKYEELPRSDLKSFNLAPDGSYIYVQSVWKQYRGNHTNIVVDGVHNEINEGDAIYRSRWWGDIPGWRKPV